MVNPILGILPLGLPASASLMGTAWFSLIWLGLAGVSVSPCWVALGLAETPEDGFCETGGEDFLEGSFSLGSLLFFLAPPFPTPAFQSMPAQLKVVDAYLFCRCYLLYCKA